MVKNHHSHHPHHKSHSHSVKATIPMSNNKCETNPAMAATHAAVGAALGAWAIDRFVFGNAEVSSMNAILSGAVGSAIASYSATMVNNEAKKVGALAGISIELTTAVLVAAVPAAVLYYETGDATTSLAIGAAAAAGGAAATIATVQWM